jgi:hypothetical protein
MGYNHRYNFAKLVFHSRQPAISSDFKSFDKPPNQQKTQTCDKSIGRSCTTQITEHLRSSNEILKRFSCALACAIDLKTCAKLCAMEQT